MDVTNPGLVNVADQVAGNPSLAPSGPTLAVPLQVDILEDVAGDGHPRGQDVSQALDAASTTFPTPVEFQAGDELLAPVSQDYGQVPGVAPTFAPTPQNNIADTLAQQQFPGVGTTEVVVGPDGNIQTNQNAESERTYTVTTVADADTGGVVVDPKIPVTGTFGGVVDGGTGYVTIVSPTVFPASIVDGIVVVVKSISGTSYDIVGYTSSVTSMAGTISAVSPSTGGKVTVSSSAALPAELVDGTPVTLATGVAAYDGFKTVSGVTNLSGTFTKVASAGGGTQSLVVSTTHVPATLATGKYASLVGGGGTYAGAYLVTNLGLALGGNYDTAADNGAGGTTFHSTTALPDELAVGQTVTLAGAVYAGTYEVTAVNSGAQTLDLAVAFSATDAGTWVQSGNYAFTADVAFAGDASGTWTCHTFDVVATYSVTVLGTWNSYTFSVPGTYVATATGTWSYTEIVNYTTRYKIGVTPADLTALGISMLDRELVFADDTLTAADRGASRLVEFYGAGYVVVSRSDPDDEGVPVMTAPQAGDTFAIYVQREASEVFVERQGATAEVTIAPPPPLFVPDAPQALLSQGTVDVTVGPQPGAPVLSSGVQVPTARTVQVADQSTSVGLPRNVFV